MHCFHLKKTATIRSSTTNCLLTDSHFDNSIRLFYYCSYISISLSHSIALLAFCDPYVTLLQSPFVLLASVIYLFLGSLRIIKCRVLHSFVLSTATTTTATNTTTLKYEEVHCVIFCIYLFPLKLYCTLFLFTVGHNKVFVPFLHRAVLGVTVVVIVDTKAKATAVAAA